MAAPTKINNPNVEALINHKQSELPSENTLETPGRPNKRPTPESPEDLLATSKQQTRQTRHRSTSVGEKGRSASVSTKKTPVQKKTITVQVIEALTSPEVLGKIIPILSDKISESITDSINSSVEASIKALMDEHIIPLKQTLKEQQKRIDEQKEMIYKQAHLVVQRIQEEQHLKSSLKEKDKEIDSLQDIVINLEVRLEHQEQYSRRTSLRFHNIDVPVDDRGHISTNDISRSHVIGKVRNGKSQVIVRFLSYRCREKVYNSKRNLKNDADRIFITENLTKTRTNLVKSLADLKYNQNIKTYWTTDGRVYAKLNESSRRTLIRNHDQGRIQDLWLGGA
jgi:hypothetical protein